MFTLKQSFYILLRFALCLTLVGLVNNILPLGVGAVGTFSECHKDAFVNSSPESASKITEYSPSPECLVHQANKKSHRTAARIASIVPVIGLYAVIRLLILRPRKSQKNYHRRKKWQKYEILIVIILFILCVVIAKSIHPEAFSQHQYATYIEPESFGIYPSTN